MRQMELMKFTETNPLWDIFITFHSGGYTGDDRTKAKALLFHIHYGNYDTTYAMSVALRIRKEKEGR